MKGFIRRLLLNWRWRAVAAGLAPPWPVWPGTASAATAAAPSAEPGLDIVSEMLCALNRVSAELLRLPASSCKEVSLGAVPEGWFLSLTPAHVAWVVIGAALLWAALRIDWAGDGPIAGAIWRGIKAIGMAFAVKTVAGLMMEWRGVLGQAASVLG